MSKCNLSQISVRLANSQLTQSLLAAIFLLLPLTYKRNVSEHSRDHVKRFICLLLKLTNLPLSCENIFDLLKQETMPR